MTDPGSPGAGVAADLDQVALGHQLRDTGLRVETVVETGSTQADLAVRADAGEPGGLVLITDHQTAGRGRHGRTWTTPPGTALLMSVLLRPGPAVPAGRWPAWTLAASAAAADALTADLLPTGVKWPNDLVTVEGERKLAGVLSARHGDALLLGMGLNVSLARADLPRADTTSLLLEGVDDLDRGRIAATVLRAVASAYTDWLSPATDPLVGFRSRCVTLGRRVRVELPDGREVIGTARDVDDSGRVIVDPDGSLPPVTLSAGDVTHLRAIP